MYFLISYYNESKECPEVVKTHSHNLHFKITGLARRFFPETVLKQDTLLLSNPKECRGKKSLSILPPWEFQTPLSLGTPGLLINLPRNWLSQHPDDLGAQLKCRFWFSSSRTRPENLNLLIFLINNFIMNICRNYNILIYIRKICNWISFSLFYFNFYWYY